MPTTNSVLEPPQFSGETPEQESLTPPQWLDREKDASGKTIWIDLDNSPHVPFFLPIITELRRHGVHILLTARNTYQVCDLLDYFHVHCKVVGRHYGKHRLMKVLGNISRAFQLTPTIAHGQPDLAISHGSRAQILVGKALGIPTIMMQDYEHSTRTGFLEADWIFTPEVVPDGAMSRRPDHVLKYAGLKEDVYVPGFHPDASILKQLGIMNGDVVVTVRPPATEAHYHNPESDLLFAETLKFLDRPHVKVVILPRSHNQDDVLRHGWSRLLGSGRAVIPDKTVDGLNLIWFSDLVISGGGTMNREAASLGVPVHSIFRGQLGAVDQYLANHGRLTLIKSVADIPRKIVLKKWNRPATPDTQHRRALDTIINNILWILCSTPSQ